MIPDDARELDRDVQAYQRELRAQRRRQRARRLRGPLTRDGMVLPLLAGCLILALITSTLLIMFAADQTGMPGLGTHSGAAPLLKHQPTTAPSHPAAGQVGGPLPEAVIILGGKHVQLLSITAAQPSVLALISVDCPCAPALRALRVQAAQAHVALYVVGTGRDQKHVARLAAQAGQNSAQVGEDTHNVLGPAYDQLGLTAILVLRGGAVYKVVQYITLSSAENLAASMRRLATAGQ